MHTEMMAVNVWTCIKEVLGSNLGDETRYADWGFLWFRSPLLPSQSFPIHLSSYQVGCAIAQAVSRRRPTAVARVRSCWISGGQSGTRAGFLRVLRFPLPTVILPTAPHIICHPGLVQQVK
jgi:hypothetical protein